MFNVLVCDISITVPIFTAFVWTFFFKKWGWNSSGQQRTGFPHSVFSTI